MTVFDVIRRRRSIGKMTGERPTRGQIERLLEAATHAPNHHNEQPWKFLVLAGDVRAQIGAAMAESLADKLKDVNDENAQARLTKERNKLLRAPVIIVIVAQPPSHPQALEIENIEATAAAVQNMLLVGEEMGLATMWRTGNAAYDLRVKRALGLSPHEAIVAFLYVGFSAIPKLERHPVPFEEKTTWLGWEE